MAGRGQHKVIGSDGKAYWLRPDGTRYPVGSLKQIASPRRLYTPGEPVPFDHPGGNEGPGLVNGEYVDRVSVPKGTPMFRVTDGAAVLSAVTRIDTEKNRKAAGGQKIQAMPETARTDHPSVLRDRLREGAEGRLRAHTIQDAIRARDAYMDMMYAAYVKVSGVDPCNVCLYEVVGKDGSRVFYFAEREDARSGQQAY